MIENVYDPQSLNRYSFERNNPYKYRDDDGHIAFVPILIAGGIGGLVGLGTYFLTHDDYTWKGALSYAGGGAIAGAAGVVNLAAAAIGGVASQVAMNYGDEKSLGEGTVGAGLLSGVSFGLADELLPISRYWLIKNPSSWFTTKTGQTFIANQFTEQVASQTGITAGQFLAQRQSQSQILYDYFKYQSYFSEKKDTSVGSSKGGGRGGGGCKCGVWGDLRETAEKNKDKTAGEIIENAADHISIESNYAGIVTSGALNSLGSYVGGKLFPTKALNKNIANMKDIFKLLTTKSGNELLTKNSFDTGLSNAISISIPSIFRFTNFYQQYQENNRQKIISEAKSGTYSGGSGYNPSAGAYVTDNGHVYPTNNPDWKPCGCSIN